MSPIATHAVLNWNFSTVSTFNSSNDGLPLVDNINIPSATVVAVFTTEGTLSDLTTGTDPINFDFIAVTSLLINGAVPNPLTSSIMSSETAASDGEITWDPVSQTITRVSLINQDPFTHSFSVNTDYEQEFSYFDTNNPIDGAKYSLGANTFTLTPSAVPEPSAYALLAGCGLLSIVLLRRRRS